MDARCIQEHKNLHAFSLPNQSRSVEPNPLMPAPKLRNGPRLLIIDNYDSYTFNLYQYIIRANSGQEPVVVRNNQFTWEEMKNDIIPYFDGIVISPGPGKPTEQEDFGVCASVLLECNLPIFGVCLGHQGLASALGGQVVKASSPVHGRISPIHHDGMDIFHSIPSPFNAVRYHSLVVSPQDTPSELAVNAWCNDDRNNDDASSADSIIMGFRHLSKPIWSVQFHPESICTEFGQIIVNNFCKLVEKHWGFASSLKADLTLPEPLKRISAVPSPLLKPVEFLDDECSSSSKETSNNPGNFYALLSCINNIIDSEAVFTNLYAETPDSFWLDSARIEKGLSRYSYMGSVGGPNSFRLHYSLLTKSICRTDTKVDARVSSEIPILPGSSFFEYLANLMDSSTCSRVEEVCLLQTKQEPETPIDFSVLPPFLGGLVGYIGYEMKSETLNLGGSKQAEFKTLSNPTAPDSSFLFSDQTLVFDHEESKIYIVALVDEKCASVLQQRKLQTAWIQRTRDRIELLMSCLSERGNVSAVEHQWDAPVKKIPQVTLVHKEPEYLDMIGKSIDLIREGETYEVCLTTQLQARLKQGHPHPYEMYKHLRHRNPAPYAAYLNFGLKKPSDDAQGREKEEEEEELIIASSSPERFLRVDHDQTITMKPIKGTVKRATASDFKKGASPEEIDAENKKRCDELASSEKNRSENLMIVDLIRNDLNQISVLDSVHVPALMVVESYATVHQLVTTVASKLRPELTPVDAVMRSFPPGSMTGAPKLRTVQLIEDLEKGARGPYSGVLGFFSVSGPADFNVVIRTSVFTKKQGIDSSNTSNSTGGGGGRDTLVTVGAGGAIVILSDPKEEFDEMVLKAHSVLPSLSAIYRNHFV